MKIIVFILSISILVSCSFKAERKSEINQRIHELQQRIAQRANQEIIYKEALNAAMIEYQDDSATSTKTPERMIRFFETINPVSEALSELEAQDKADDAEISKLIEQRSRL